MRLAERPLPPHRQFELYRRRALRSENTRVVIADINMRFGSMVLFMVKWAFAAIPALIIIFVVLLLVMLGLSMFVGGVSALFSQ